MIHPLRTASPLLQQDVPGNFALSVPEFLKVNVPTVRTSVGAEHVDLDNHRQIEGGARHHAAALSEVGNQRARNRVQGGDGVVNQEQIALIH
ncbi:hypothetical protein D3C75_1076800 [compost metagenome]